MGIVSWREEAQTVIRSAIAENSERIPDASELFKFISKKYYPFGERNYHPYKVWLKVIAEQKQLYIWKNRPPVKEEIKDPNQIEMFEV